MQKKLQDYIWLIDIHMVMWANWQGVFCPELSPRMFEQDTFIPKSIIEISDYGSAFKKSLTGLGLNYEISSYDSLDKNTYLENKTYILYGTIEFIGKASRLLSSKNIEYLSLGFNADLNIPSKMMHQIDNKFLLNDKFIIMPWKMILDNKSIPFDAFGVNSIFIKPNSGKKAFAGSSTSINDIDRLESTLHIPGDVDTFIAPAKKISDIEARAVIVNDMVVDIGFYSHEHILKNENIFSITIQKMKSEVLELIENKIGVDSISHSLAYTVDFCYQYTSIGQETQKELKLIEFNSFCSACFYTANVSEILFYLMKTLTR